jgi:pimeloyl-ACP methyl ester carboxylesterase
MLKLSGLPIEQIQQKNIKVGEFNKQPINIRTMICGDETKPKLVFLHGFGASGPLYYTIIKPLAEHFCLILLDNIGMGGSSRPRNYD